MKKLQLKKIMSSAVLTAAILPMSAFAAKSYIPADFDFTAQDLAKSVELVGVQDGFHVVYCQSDVDTDGEALHVNCYDNSLANLDTETEKAVEALAFTPAKVDGETVPVRMRFRVVYRQGDDLKADLIPNLGTMQAKYGRDYVAPQERMDGKDWYSRYSEASWVGGVNFFTEGDEAKVAATIGKSGKAEVVHMMETEAAYERDAKIVKNSVRRSNFIPGFVNGQPVPMNYLAVVSYENEGEAVSSRD